MVSFLRFMVEAWGLIAAIFLDLAFLVMFDSILVSVLLLFLLFLWALRVFMLSKEVIIDA